MAEALGVTFFLLLALQWVLVAGKRSGTRAQSGVALVTYAVINYGLYSVQGLVDDQATYFVFAGDLSDALLDSPATAQSNFTAGKESFVWILALLFVLFGQSALPGLAFNTMLMVTLPAILVWAGRNFGILSRGQVTGWVAVLAPPFLLWGHGLDREPLVFFLLSTMLLSFSLLARRRWCPAVAGILLVSYALSFSRSSLLMVVAASTVAMVSYSISKAVVSRTSWARMPGLTFLLFAFSSLTAVYLAVLTFSARFFQSSFWNGFGIGIPELSSPTQATAIPGATWDQNSSPGGFLYNVVRSLIGPLPWEVTNSSLLFFAVEGLIYMVFFSILVTSIVASSSVRAVGAWLWISALPLVVASALLLANYGLNSRIRAHIFLLLALLFEPSWEKLWGRARINFQSLEYRLRDSK